MGMLGPSLKAFVNATIVKEKIMAKKTQKKSVKTEGRTGALGIRFEVYRDASGEHRWRMVDGNNRIVGTSAEGYTRSRDAHRAIENILVDLADPELPMGLTVVSK
jgi:uncharacterized protein YegP (UPF0339 family)